MKLPVKEMLGSVPGVFGIRLEEEPAHVVTLDDGAFQVRHYSQMLLAQTDVSGDRDSAMDQGFEILGSYIFGKNKTTTELSMTTPVLQEKADARGSNAWTISFVMPAEFSKITAPVPIDRRIRLTTSPAMTLAVYRYSGNCTIESMHEAEDKLRAWLSERSFEPVGPVMWAQYDQPFAVPFLKRNEALIEIRAHRLN